MQGHPMATALRDAGAEVVMTECVGIHGDAFWREVAAADGGVAFGRA